MTSAGQQPPDLGDRYGRAHPGRRTAGRVVIAVVAVVLLGWLAWAAYDHATPDVRSELVGYEVLSEHEATAVLDVALADDVEEATCRVRATAVDHTTVGEATLVVRAGDARRREVSIRTERRATAVEKVGCTTPDQPRPR